MTGVHSGAGGLVAPLLSFRLDPARRRETTVRALETNEAGVPPEIPEELGAVLSPGEAIVAVLVEHVCTTVLADAVARSGGSALADELVTTSDAAEFGPQVLAVSARWRRRPAAWAGRDC